MLSRLVVSLFICSFFLVSPHVDSAVADDSQSGAVDLIESGIDFGSSVGIGALNIVQSLATFGINLINGSRRGLKNLIRNTSGAIKRQAQKNLRRSIKLRKKLAKQRKDFNRLTKRILRIAASGADVPKSLANKAGNLATNIARSYQRAIELEQSNQALQAQAATP